MTMETSIYFVDVQSYEDPLDWQHCYLWLPKRRLRGYAMLDLQGRSQRRNASRYSVICSACSSRLLMKDAACSHWATVWLKLFASGKPTERNRNFERTKWRFPEIGVPHFIIPFSGIFPYKPSSYWDTPYLWKPPFMLENEDVLRLAKIINDGFSSPWFDCWGLACWESQLGGRSWWYLRTQPA